MKILRIITFLFDARRMKDRGTNLRGVARIEHEDGHVLALIKGEELPKSWYQNDENEYGDDDSECDWQNEEQAEFEKIIIDIPDIEHDKTRNYLGELIFEMFRDLMAMKEEGSLNFVLVSMYGHTGYFTAFVSPEHYKNLCDKKICLRLFD